MLRRKSSTCDVLMLSRTLGSTTQPRGMLRPCGASLSVTRTSGNPRQGATLHLIRKRGVWPGNSLLGSGTSRSRAKVKSICQESSDCEPTTPLWSREPRGADCSRQANGSWHGGNRRRASTRARLSKQGLEQENRQGLYGLPAPALVEQRFPRFSCSCVWVRTTAQSSGRGRVEGRGTF